MAATLRLNEEHNGLELLFPDSERPDAAVRAALKEKGFRWHHVGKYWFARNTEDRLAFAQKLTGAGEKAAEPEKVPEEKTQEPKKDSKPKKEKASKEDNTFAAVYDAIGTFQIKDGADIKVHDIPNGMFCKDLNALIRSNWGHDKFITVTDLTNAGKTGKNCTTWRLYPESNDELVCNALMGQENIYTCQELVQALREGKTFDSLRMYSSEDKGIETFSPFVETKPLSKMPETWNKRNFTQALLSGQIYMGQVDYRYTDDYAMDAAYNFSEGVGINIPVFVMDAVENWYSTTYVRTNSCDGPNNTCTIGFSEHSNTSKTLYFDLNCNIREGKRRADERAAGIKSYNDMMKASCIQVNESSIDESKIYSVISLDTNTNNGVYTTKTANVQGAYLLEQLAEDLGYLDILSVKELEIVPDKLYEVSSFYHRHSFYEPDDRIIDCGNNQRVVTGKALLELTAEGVSLPYIQEGVGDYSSIEAARENLSKFIRGDRMLMFTGLKTNEYEKALASLNREAERAGHNCSARTGIDNLISAAQQKSESQVVSGHKKSTDLLR